MAEPDEKLAALGLVVYFAQVQGAERTSIVPRGSFERRRLEGALRRQVCVVQRLRCDAHCSGGDVVMSQIVQPGQWPIRIGLFDGLCDVSMKQQALDFGNTSVH